MKKIYFLASMLMLGSAVTAQIQTAPIMKAKGTNTIVNQERPTGQDRAPGDPIPGYGDDFSTSANWTMTNASSPSGNFVIGTTNAGPSPGIASTTAANGFAMYDADATGVDLSSTTDAQMTYNTVMDLSSYPAVAVSFESLYQEYQTQVFVEVSTNGLAGPWTQYEVHLDVTDNNLSANAELVNVNISSQAGGQPNVAVRFNYVGGWGWFWEIDDFQMIEAYQNELETTWAGHSAGPQGLDYYAVPTDQITEITFGSQVQSNGVTQQTNVQMTASVDGGTTYSGTSSQSVSLNEAQMDTFSIETPNGWTPSGAGTHNLVISCGADQTEELPANNDNAFNPITIGGDVYARHDGVLTGGFAGFVTTQGDPLAVGNIMDIVADQTFGKIDVGITTAATNEGQLMYAAIYKWDGSDYVYETQTADYQILAADLGGIISLNLPSNYNALAGDDLLVVAGHYGGTDEVSFAEAQPTYQGSVLAVHSSGLIQGADPAAVMVALNSQPTEVGIEEVEAATGLNMYPNPADKVTQLTYNIVNEGNVTLTFTDLSGKVVFVENFGSQAEGQYTYEVSTSELSNGVYFYSLQVGDNAITKKFVVSH